MCVCAVCQRACLKIVSQVLNTHRSLSSEGSHNENQGSGNKEAFGGAGQCLRAYFASPRYPEVKVCVCVFVCEAGHLLELMWLDICVWI